MSVAILAQGRANLVQDFRTWGVSLVRLCAWRRGGFCLHPQVPSILFAFVCANSASLARTFLLDLWLLIATILSLVPGTSPANDLEFCTTAAALYTLLLFAVLLRLPLVHSCRVSAARRSTCPPLHITSWQLRRHIFSGPGKFFPQNG